jgi:type VI secretion system protein ImpK
LTQTAAQSKAARGPESDPRRGLLAVALQEVLTVTARIRSDRQVAEDANSLRGHVKRLLGRADREARDAGYQDETVRLALYATVAFLDESILNSPRPMFQDWPRQPLQEEVFGDHMAGETFYLYLDDLLSRQDSAELADLLEVFQLCLLLGFRGRYGAGQSGERGARLRAVNEKLLRIRGPHGPMAPSWAPPADEAQPGHQDPWVRRLGVAAVVSLALALLVFGLLRFGLRPGLGAVQDLTAGIVG